MRYQLQSQYGQFSWKPRYFTDAIKVLIGVNLLLFIFRIIAQDQADLAGIFGSRRSEEPERCFVEADVDVLLLAVGFQH